MAPAHYVLVEIATKHFAFLRPEAEARASEATWASQQRFIQPHRLGSALQQLIQQGRLAADHEVTRGGRQITTFRLADMTGRERPTQDAAARKRLLYARYLSWSSGSRAEPGLVGPAAERMVHNTLRDASPERGYQLENPAKGTAAVVHTVKVPGGPLDNAAHLFIGRPPVRFTLAIEVKSRREWMYQTSNELYQVLYKAAALQRLMPDERIVPVLVCRRSHITAFRLFKDLGGYIVEVRDQWLPNPHSRVNEADFREVRNELNFLDLGLMPPGGVHFYLRRHLVTHLPRELPSQAARWTSAGHMLELEYEALWRDEPLIHLARIRDAISQEPWYLGGW